VGVVLLPLSFEGGDGRFNGEGATLLYVDEKKGSRNAHSLHNVIGQALSCTYASHE
jgi:hypothetical protein